MALIPPGMVQEREAKGAGRRAGPAQRLTSLRPYHRRRRRQRLQRRGQPNGLFMMLLYVLYLFLRVFSSVYCYVFVASSTTVNLGCEV